MLAVLLALLLFVIVVEPLLVAIHEFGHAAVPLAQGRETAVFVGGDRGPTISIGALTLTIAPAGFLRPVTDGATLSDVQTGRWTMLGGTLGGPVASVLVAASTWIAIRPGLGDMLWWLLFLAFVYSATQATVTLLPLKAGAAGDDEEPYRTDGRIALELLFGTDPVLDEERA